MSLEEHSIQPVQNVSHILTRIANSTPPTLQYHNSQMVDASGSQTTKGNNNYTATSTPTLPSKNTPTPSNT